MKEALNNLRMFHIQQFYHFYHICDVRHLGIIADRSCDQSLDLEAVFGDHPAAVRMIDGQLRFLTLS
jgi:hypothetical protein